MKYVYRVTHHWSVGALYFSSFKKAEEYCRENGCPVCVYSDNYLRQFEDFNHKTTIDVQKEQVR